MAATETLPVDMTVAVQGLVNLFLNMDGKSREMFIKLLVVKMEEEELDLILEVVDIRNNSNNDFKEDDVKIETGKGSNDSNYALNYETEPNNDKNTEDKKIDLHNEGSPFTLKDEISIENQISSNKTNNFNLKNHKLTVTSPSELKCSYCDQSFFNKKDLKTHKATHPEYNEENEKRPFLCDICPKSFYTSTDLKRHKNMHDGIKPFLCDECPHASLTKNQLKVHKLRLHTENRPKSEDLPKTFICEICSKAFGSNERLKVHFSRQHTKDNVFNCDQCSYETTHITSMKVHKTTHTGERPYSCHVCRKTFKIPQSLQRHIKQVHLGEKRKQVQNNNAATEKNHLCDLCSMAFSTRGTLTKHRESIHEGIKYDCDQCGYKATERGNLARHKAAIHEGIKFASQECLCQECGYQTTSKQRLKDHEESVHLGIKHECSQCDHKAATKANLLLHVASVHENIQRDCKECDYTTFKKRAFLKHMTEHRKALELQNESDYSTSSPFGMSVN